MGELRGTIRPGSKAAATHHGHRSVLPANEKSAYCMPNPLMDGIAPLSEIRAPTNR